MHRLISWLILLATVLSAPAAPTNYFCIVCGQGPLRQHVWLHPRGPICDDCEKLPDRCSLCGLPVKAGDGHVKTGDGRLICRFDQPNAILTQDQARELFAQVREEVVDLYGPQFRLKYPEVTVTLFDIDYWSEKGQRDGLHAFGFASTRPAGDGSCTHYIVMLSGRTREEMEAVAAHEYTHLWINENRPASHEIEGDTVEAICELTAYKLMEHKHNAGRQKRILENPYTRGRINDLIGVEHDGGTDYVLNWVKSSTATMFDVNSRLAPLGLPTEPSPLRVAPRVLPAGLKFTGTMAFGQAPLAVINGEEFAAGDQKSLKLRDQSVRVRCLEVQAGKVQVEVNGKPLSLLRGEERPLP